ncbi:MAG: SGNH/GDSL hydrolase family protein, partial [Lachnospiraceae bacterium]|nr:SGNH/GDSL hydrolase family protein [Lachnospiraceae bacterium]
EGERLEDRVRCIREVAQEEQVCLADAYDVWEMARDAGCDWRDLLANYFNHPSVEGHTVYAITLMKLME